VRSNATCGGQSSVKKGDAMHVDYLVVGAGLTGATIARMLHDAGREVLVVERRAHVGGNVHDTLHPSGIRVHTYGPHYFRTSSAAIWRFVNRFSAFYRYEACVRSWVDDAYEQWPIPTSYLARTTGVHWQPAFQGTPTNFEEAALAMMPEVVYRKFVEGYTEKQWGVAARNLSKNLVKRFTIRENNDPRLALHKYQGIPIHGYHTFMQQMLAGIPVWLNYDYLQDRTGIKAGIRVIFTGAIDAFFHFDLGRLRYRGQQRVERYLPAVNCYQPCAQVNNPDLQRGPHIRTLEWKQMMPPAAAQQLRGTVITEEIPFTAIDVDQYEYPFPDQANQALYQAYRKRANALHTLLICGRLGEYCYYDMDQAIARAMLLVKRLLTDHPPGCAARTTGNSPAMNQWPKRGEESSAHRGQL
jgi:UDP-galactopyranose mutase